MMTATTTDTKTETNRADSLLTVKNLSLTLSGQTILEDVSLSLGAGELLALVGPNGAGKTSLLKCILQLYSPTEGSVTVAGQNVGECDTLTRAKLLSYVPQQAERFLDFTTEEFVEMGLYSHGLRYGFSAIVSERVYSALARVEMEKFCERKLLTLSGGELQKVYLAGALAQNAKTLLLDEPTSALDPLHRLQALRIIKEAKKRDGIGVVLVTHDINTALGFADRIVALKDGVTHFDGAPEEFAQPEILEKLYETKFRLAKDPDSGRSYALPPSEID